MTPESLKYTRTHEWVRLDGDTAIVGVTDHAQEAMGDVTFVELPETGKAVTQSEECGVIESVKAASDLYAPLAGEIGEANQALESTPELINQEPYEGGWIFKLRNVDGSQLEGLLDAAQYTAQVESEG